MLALSYNKYESDEYYCEFFNRVSDTIIFLDEGFYGRLSGRIVDGIIKSDNIFVLMMRKAPTNLIHPLCDTYELKVGKIGSKLIFENIEIAKN